MGKYGSGVSFTSACKMDRDEIVHALKDEMIVNETEKGFEWGPLDENYTTKEEIILSAYDEAVYQAQVAMRSGRAMEELLMKHGVRIEKYFMEYMRIVSRLEAEDYAKEHSEEADEQDNE